MNAPAGFVLDSNGQVVKVMPVQVIFNASMPWQRHTWSLPAYLVGGFLIASVYAVGMLRGPAGPLPLPRLSDPVHCGSRDDANPAGYWRWVGALGV
jgi:hypothetical protein